MSTENTPSQVVRTVLISDLVDSTRVTEKLGDVRASEAFARQDRISRDLLRKHHGREIDRSDGFLCLFERPHDAVRYALEAQLEHAKIGAAYGVPFDLRVGIHLGEVILRENPSHDVEAGAKRWQAEGIAVPTAARISALAGPRQTLMTKAAFDLARRAQSPDEATTEQSIRWLAHGPYLLKGIEEPLDIHEVGVDGFAPLTPPANSEKARRAVRAGEEDVFGWRPAQGLQVPGRPNFTLIEKLGEGGFGEVWLARHSKTQSQQIFKFCFQADRLRGLKREVALFRVLQSLLGGRTDIARVIDWQFEHPPFFLEAEYTEGGTLAEWVESSGGCDAIPIDTRIEIAAQIATAVGAAHSVGVLHKDLKPSNILITKSPTGAPMARLTDFGIGLLTDLSVLSKQGITETGMTEDALGQNDSSRTGSRLYMAPELIEGKGASIQSDVYSLGVVLYQMFGGGFGRALATGWEGQVHDPLVREDIAACVSGDPDKRLRSADELAHRLRTRASRRSAAIRRRAGAATALLALVLLVSTGFLAIAFKREEKLRLEAVAAREVAEKARKSEQVARAQAEDLTYFMLFDMFQRLKEIGRLSLMEKIAQKSTEYLDATRSESGTSDSLKRRSMAYDHTGEVFIMKGDPSLALENYEKSLKIRQSLLTSHPADLGIMRQASGSWNMIGRAQRELGRVKEATDAFAEDVKLSRRAFNIAPADNANVLGLAQALSTHADMLRRTGDLDGAEKELREAYSLAELLSAKAPQDATLQSLRASAIRKVAEIADLRGKYDESAEFHLKGIAIAEESLKKDPENTRLLQSVYSGNRQLASVLLKMKDYEGARPYVERIVAIGRQLSELEPANSQYQTRRADSLNMRGRLNRRAGDIEAAFTDLSAAADLLRKEVEKAPEGLDLAAVFSTYLRELALAERARGDEAASDAHFAEALEILRKLCQKSESLDYKEELALTLIVMGRAEEARPIVETLKGTEGRAPEYHQAVKDAGL